MTTDKYLEIQEEAETLSGEVVDLVIEYLHNCEKDHATHMSSQETIGYIRAIKDLEDLKHE